MIYCFSGTGNTRLVAERLANYLGKRAVGLDKETLANPGSATLQCDDELVIWAFPTYSWGVPPVIVKLLENATLRFNPGALHMAVTTCGDDTGNLPSMWRGLLKRKGLKPGAVYSVQMPNTYVMMKGFDVDSEKLASSKTQAMDERVQDIARNIREGKITADTTDVIKGTFTTLKTRVIYPWFTKFKMTPRGYHVSTHKCISCGACNRACPTGNITMSTNGNPEWGDNCAFCTACYHVCPRHAIEWRNATRTKGQYKLKAMQ